MVDKKKNKSDSNRIADKREKEALAAIANNEADRKRKVRKRKLMMMWEKEKRDKKLYIFTLGKNFPF